MSSVTSIESIQQSLSNNIKNEKELTPKAHHISSQVEFSFFDQLGNNPLWISQPFEHPRVKKMNLSTEILLEGYLYKKSGNENLILKPRYFVLYEDRLEVFRDEKEMKNTQASNLMLLEAVRLDLRPIYQEDYQKLKEKEQYYLMFLSCKMRFFLFAKDKESQNQWVKQLKRTCILTNYPLVYENLKILGKGTFAKVFLSREIGGDRQEYAVKTFNKQALLSDKSSEKAKVGLLNEIQILRKCNHPNIIKLYEVHESSNYIYLVQSVLKGGELFDTIVKTGKFSEKNAGLIIHQLISALEFLHSKNIMHRDIKPENLILVDNSNDFNIKLADFGLAALTSDELIYKRCGTPGYVAPEILEDQKYDCKVDIFSAGVIFYILLTGCSPFYGKTYNEILFKNKACQISFDFTQLGVKVSQEASDLVKKMLQANPKERISATKALDHSFFEKLFDQYDQLDTSIDSLDLGMEENTAFQNMLTFQTKFNVSNIKPLDIKGGDKKGLVSMTPMIIGRNLTNPQGDDIINQNESWISPQKNLRDFSQGVAISQSEYMNKLFKPRKNNQEEEYQFESNAYIPETPVQIDDSQRNIKQMPVLDIPISKKPSQLVTSSTGNRNAVVNSILKKLV